MDWGDITQRAVSTALQTFVATVPVAAVSQGQWALLIPPLCGALAAGLSVAQNMMLQYRANKEQS
mgnify:CR=1 FL=1|jgi:hypothetical protein